MSQFTIAEFEDGLQLIPTKWLNGTTECLWPTQRNIKRLHKSIIECEEPDYEKWGTVKVIRIFGTANSYESGIRKVQLAEHFSDIDSSDIDTTSKKVKRRIMAKKVVTSDEDENDLENMLPPPPKKPVVKSLSTNIINNKHMDDSPSLENYVKKRNKDNTLKPVQDIVKNRFTELSVLQDNNNAILLTDIEFKKELLRKCNKIDAKIDRIDNRLNRIEERLENISDNKNDDYFDVTEVVSFPLKTEEALQEFELHLQNTNFFKTMVTFMKQLGGKTYEEMIVIILKYTISNYLSTLYCWHGRAGKKAAFKDFQFVKCIKQCVHSKFETANDQQIIHVISKWLVQGKLRHDRDEERLLRQQNINIQRQEEEEEEEEVFML